MLELLVSPWQAEHRPVSMFLFGFLFSAIAFAVTVQFINIHYAGLVSVFFVVLILTPMMFQIFQRDKDSVLHAKEFFPKHHQELIISFLALFLGIAFSYVGWYLLLPAETAQAAFTLQSASVGKEYQFFKKVVVSQKRSPFSLGISLLPFVHDPHAAVHQMSSTREDLPRRCCCYHPTIRRAGPCRPVRPWPPALRAGERVLTAHKPPPAL